MGWFWGDSTARDEPHLSTTQNPPFQNEVTPSPSNPLPPSAQSKPAPLTREELADAELSSLLASLSTPEPPQPQPQPSSSSPFPFPPTAPTPTISQTSIHPSALLPTTMSCRDAFDRAFYCHSLGGQFTSIYRYGTMRKCSDQWGNFWFCMRTNRGVMEEEERKRRIQEHYRQREERARRGGCSEDVWGLRAERVEGAFEGDLERLEEEGRRGGEVGRGIG